MLTILDLLNHYLGFFNVNTTWKGKIYTLLATIGNFYILYLGISHIRNGAYLRGSLLILGFIAILYFAILNIFYYYTKKTLKWDISPKIEKILGGKPADINQTTQRTAAYVPANGLYTKQDVLPASIYSDQDMQAELNKLADQLIQSGMMTQDFGGLSEEEQLAHLITTDVIYANHPGTPLPYFRLETERGGLAVYGGLNEMMAKRLGRIKTVGLMPIESALKTYDLFLATVVLKGGLGHSRGRANVTEVNKPYILQAELAYKTKK